jgi:hypothetical protein
MQQHITSAATLCMSPALLPVLLHPSPVIDMGSLLGQLVQCHNKAEAAVARKNACMQQHITSAATPCMSPALLPVLLHPSPVIALGSLLGQLVQCHNKAEAARTRNKARMQQHIGTGSQPCRGTRAAGTSNKAGTQITLQQQHLMHFTCTLRLCVAVFHPHCSHGQLMGQLLHSHNEARGRWEQQ